MPPHKAPSKLYDSARNKFNEMLDTTCHNIWFLHWTYDIASEFQVISKVQNFLTASIPVSVLDDTINMPKPGNFLDVCSTSTSGDIKILLGLVMHRHMRFFKINTLDIPKNLTSKVEESFWVSQLNKMSNLVFLDLSLVCTDEILKTVGQNCTQLEEVTVISKMSQLPEGGNFNALRKLYHVSDLGLSYLTQCQKLKCITINRSNRSGVGEITEKGICTLICSLPNLKSINYEFMGAVLAHIPLTSPPLRLQYLRDLRANPASIELYNTLCPSLIRLDISLPTNLCPKDSILQSEAIVEALSNSSLMLKLLDQSFLCVSHGVLETLLAKKGTNLVCITFGLGCCNLDLETLRLIGLYCPNVEELTIRTMSPYIMASSLPKPKSSMFQKLTSLYLSSQQTTWDARHAVSLCLQGYQIVDLSLSGAQENLDGIFTKLIRCKKLSALKYLLLHRHCYISKAIIWQILQDCPQIRTFIYIYDHTFTADELKAFQEFINNNNYDLDLKISNHFY